MTVKGSLLDEATRALGDTIRAALDAGRRVPCLGRGEWLADDPLVIIERSKRETAPTLPDALSDHWSKTYGETIVFYLRTPEREVPHD